MAPLTASVFGHSVANAGGVLYSASLSMDGRSFRIRESRCHENHRCRLIGHCCRLGASGWTAAITWIADLGGSSLSYPAGRTLERRTSRKQTMQCGQETSLRKFQNLPRVGQTSPGRRNDGVVPTTVCWELYLDWPARGKRPICLFHGDDSGDDERSRSLLCNVIAVKKFVTVL